MTTDELPDQAELDRLHSRHTSSWRKYFDPEQIGLRLLLVSDAEVSEPGKGLGVHPYGDAEIFSYVAEAADHGWHRQKPASSGGRRAMH